MEEVDGSPGEDTAPVQGVGAALRAAREEKGLSLAEVSATTRIQPHHLEMIEAGDFSALPSRTYALGFTRTYARLVGLDEQATLQRVRDQLSEGDPRGAGQADRFEPGDPARVPGRGLAWFAVLAAALLLGGIYAFYTSYFAPGVGPAPLATPEEQQAAQPPVPAETAAPATLPTGGPVVFTSELDGTWVKFYDANGTRLYEAQMNAGDSYTVPEDAEGPQLWTGRPYALAITIGGRSVPKISEEDRTVRDVPVTAEALLAREPAPAPAATPSPATGTAESPTRLPG